MLNCTESRSQSELSCLDDLFPLNALRKTLTRSSNYAVTTLSVNSTGSRFRGKMTLSAVSVAELLQRHDVPVLCQEGKKLNERQVGEIVARRAHGKSLRQITSQVGSTKTPIATVLRHPAGYATPRPAGRNPKLSDHTKAPILREASKGLSSASELFTSNCN
ncbi:hypothetical protein H257_04520 [Aphanomyces astaci]|uniref:Transposase IS30-like HTH domain-containing protein n=1 Tax=Aphanomyces astaci TaxID=112090 RepID=W4GX79_APHAT|nr:hypothetical protein H257_04520 [Aphanomyces astaci]ETV83941.1 hypothetical protein H257_04520 [Aphanomyces astaci]|eukprot:XP_009827371.1 hypothetical protein H257_04520 [Aphanomyces astaci]